MSATLCIACNYWTATVGLLCEACAEAGDGEHERQARDTAASAVVYELLEPIQFPDGTLWRRTSDTNIVCAGPRGSHSFDFPTTVACTWAWLQVCLH